MDNQENKQRGFQAWKSPEIREIIECHGQNLEITEILECHDKSMEIYFRCVLQLDFLQRNQMTNQLDIVMENVNSVMEMSWKIVFQFVWGPCLPLPSLAPLGIAMVSAISG